MEALPDVGPPEAVKPARPVGIGERLSHIDVIRGIALFGVLIMNIHFWFRTPMWSYRLSSHPWPQAWNVGTDWFLEVVMAAKAMTLFSMLFAVGLSIQMDRVLAKGMGFRGYVLRRLGAMFLFGALHILLFWNGDILHLYALVGLLLWPFLKRKPRTILVWLAVLFGLATLAVLGLSIYQMLTPLPAYKPGGGRAAAMVQACLNGYQSHSWLAVMRFRLKDFVTMLGMTAPAAILVFLNFLIGLSVWKSGILQDPAAHLGRLRRFTLWALPLGLAANLLMAAVNGSVGPESWIRLHWSVARFFLPLVGLSQIFGLPLLALGYGAGLLILFQGETWRRRLLVLAPMGRMAFTNYILQSAVMTFLFYGWGLGLYNRLSPLAGVGIGLAFYGLQLAWSHWWLARFQFGPLEWLWRAVTYWSWPPLKLKAAPLPISSAAESAIS
jgi:uncharacterized protein